MKITHRIPPAALELKSDPISEEYWREVEASTARLERQHHKALKALEAVDRRAERVRTALEKAATKAAKRSAAREQKKLHRAIVEREAELCEVERLMVPTYCTNRDSKRRVIRLETGTITVPLGGLAPAIQTPQNGRDLHTLYRFFDQAGQLLYVGRTCDPGRRNSEHRRDKRWWLEVASQTFEHHGSFAELVHAEDCAIKTENPKYNIAGKVCA